MAEDLLAELKELTKRKVELEQSLKRLRADYLINADDLQVQADKVDDRLIEIKKGI